MELERYCIKFCQNLGDRWKSYGNFRCFYDDVMGITQIKEWYNWFKNDHSSMDSKPSFGRPSTC
ncbi:hypothetical protein C0J52_01373 [Blattella germanica]|nr:hypothetical protein C0J52_01373 [Blattella germanica]